jgi:DNA topoisomerase-1
MSRKIVTKTSLVIVESPAKCKKIESILGPGYKCIASYGHLRSIQGLEAIDVENGFNITYSVIEEDIKLKQIERIRKEIIASDEVILATDGDREGEGIAWHICQLFNLSVETTKRIIFHEITETAILTAIRNPSRVDLSLVYSQQARQVLDLLVGFKITPLLWNNIAKNHKGSLSAGRCQTPALRIVYENYLDIKKSPGKLVYNVSGYFTNLNLVFELSKQLTNKEDTKSFLEQCASNNTKFICNKSPAKKSIRKAPEPLTTSTLQQLASNELHLSPKETMKMAQQLYEAGHITYMRTDSKKYSKEFLENMKKYIITTYSQQYVSQTIDNLCSNLVSVSESDPVFNSDSVSDNKTKENKEAHEAIRPVSIQNKTDLSPDLPQKAIKLYELIRNNAIETCMPSAQYSTITATIEILGPTNEQTTQIVTNKLNFVYKAEQVVFKGWQIVNDTSNNKANEESSKAYNYFVNLKPNAEMTYKKIEAKNTLKDLKQHFTEARLVQLLEEKGIGRPSTFASLIDKIIERKYVEKQNIEGKQIECIDFLLDVERKITENSCIKEFGNEKNKLVIQPLGIIVVEFLIKHFATFFDYSYTKEMETNLDLIATNKKHWVTLCDDCNKDLIKVVDGLTSLKKFEIQIDDYHTIIIGKHGPVIKKTLQGPSLKTGKKTDTVTFIPLKKGLDINALNEFEETNSRKLELEDVVESTAINTSALGKYKGHDLFVKTGKYGPYAQWGTNMKTLKELDKPADKMEYMEVIKFLDKDILDPTKPVGLVREMSSNLSIRNGKFGDYILYKKPRAKKPEFLKLNDFKSDYKTCDKELLLNWIKQTYKIEI